MATKFINQRIYEKKRRLRHSEDTESEVNTGGEDGDELFKFEQVGFEMQYKLKHSTGCLNQELRK